MKNLVEKLGIVVATVLMACGMQANAATVVFDAALAGDFPGGAAQYEYFYVKKPGDEHFVRTDARSSANRKEPVPVTNIPVNSLICVPIAMDPWTNYNNYYFKVTQDGYSHFELTGTIKNRKFEEFAAYGKGAGLTQYLPARNAPLSFVDTNGRVFYKEHTACGE